MIRVGGNRLLNTRRVVIGGIGAIAIAALVVTLRQNISERRQMQLQQEAYKVVLACSNVHQVTYQVTGSARKIRITYNDGKGMQEIIPKTLPWSKSLKKTGDAYLFLAVSGESIDSDLAAQIFVDGRLFKEQHASAGYAELICEGTVGSNLSK